MDCKTANSIDFNRLLCDLGFKPFRYGKGCTWWLSPFRPNETIPSFKVNNNKFYDFGSSENGSVLDFLVLYWKCSIPEALARLNNLRPVFSFPKQNLPKPQNQTIKIIDVKPIQSKPLFAYLWNRCIDPKLAKNYLKEVVFAWDGGKPQYALGFENNSGSWELRNSILKLSTGKNITFISNNSRNLVCFEGFFNMLSYLQMRKTIDSDIIVLNSTINLSLAFPYMLSHEHVALYFDNDNTGRAATKRVTQLLGDKATDFSTEYRPFNDLNDFLTNKK